MITDIYVRRITPLSSEHDICVIKNSFVLVHKEASFLARHRIEGVVLLDFYWGGGGCKFSLNVNGEEKKARPWSWPYPAWECAPLSPAALLLIHTAVVCSVEIRTKPQVRVCRLKPLLFEQNTVECCVCSGVPERFEKVFLFTFALMPFLLSLFYFPWFLFSYSVADKPKKQQKSQEMCPKLCIRCGTSFNVSFCALSVLLHHIDLVHSFLCLGPQGHVNLS